MGGACANGVTKRRVGCGGSDAVRSGCLHRPRSGRCRLRLGQRAPYWPAALAFRRRPLACAMAERGRVRRLCISCTARSCKAASRRCIRSPQVCGLGTRASGIRIDQSALAPLRPGGVPSFALLPRETPAHHPLRSEPFSARSRHFRNSLQMWWRAPLACHITPAGPPVSRHYPRIHALRISRTQKLPIDRLCTQHGIDVEQTRRCTSDSNQVAYCPHPTANRSDSPPTTTNAANRHVTQRACYHASHTMLRRRTACARVELPWRARC